MSADQLRDFYNGRQRDSLDIDEGTGQVIEAPKLRKKQTKKQRDRRNDAKNQTARRIRDKKYPLREERLAFDNSNINIYGHGRRKQGSKKKVLGTRTSGVRTSGVRTSGGGASSIGATGARTSGNAQARTRWVPVKLTPEEERDKNHAPMYMEGKLAKQDLLYPWLLMGLLPLFTDGGGAKCGMYAVYGSYKEACRLLGLLDKLVVPLQSENDDGNDDGSDDGNDDDNVPTRDIEIRDFEALLDSDEYAAGALEIATRADSNEEELRQATRKEWLQIEQLGLLLKLANEKWKTEFDLGYVSQGFQYRYDDSTGGWDKTYGVETSCVIGSRRYPYNRPMIFIWNNNADNRSKHHPDSAPPHWEQFGIPPANIDPVDLQARKERVDNWGIGRNIRQWSNSRRVYYANTDQPPNLNIEGWPEHNAPLPGLPVRQGHFLTRVDFPNNIKEQLRNRDINITLEGDDVDPEDPDKIYLMRLSGADELPNEAGVIPRGVMPATSCTRININIPDGSLPRVVNRWPQQWEFGYNLTGRAEFLQQQHGRFTDQVIRSLMNATLLPRIRAVLFLAHCRSLAQAVNSWTRGDMVVYHKGQTDFKGNMQTKMRHLAREDTMELLSTSQGTLPTSTTTQDATENLPTKRGIKRKRRSDRPFAKRKLTRVDRFKTSAGDIEECTPKTEEKVRMYRVIPGHDKIGREIPLVPIGDFAVEFGELLLDCRTPREGDIVELKKLNGKIGRVRAPFLQFLGPNPFRFNYNPPTDLVPRTQYHTSMHLMEKRFTSDRQARDWVEAFKVQKIPRQVSYWNIFMMLQYVIHQALPLCRVLEGKPEVPGRPDCPGWAAFEKDEILRFEVRVEGFRTIWIAYDVEGKETRIRQNNFINLRWMWPYGISWARREGKFSLAAIIGIHLKKLIRYFKEVELQRLLEELRYSEKRVAELQKLQGPLPKRRQRPVVENNPEHSRAIAAAA